MPFNLCPYCGGTPILWRQINGNGAQVVVARCSNCDRVPNMKQPFLPKAEHPNWQAYPLYQDNTEFSEPCVIRGCGRKDTELHHFAPRALFGNEADDYPTGWLCQYHHDRWHELTHTGKWTKKKVTV
jgi:hypothetical protein